MDTPSVSASAVGELMRNATRANSTREVLLSLEPAMQIVNLTNLRYYRYSPTRKTLTSQDAILTTKSGNASEVNEFEEALRLGAVYTSELDVDDDCETFWCFSLRRPIVFKLTPGLAKPMEPNIRENGPVLINVRNHSCQKAYFTKHKERNDKWVDIPLFISETPVGKFSLDFTDEGKKLCDKNPSKAERLLNFFFEICQYVAPLLEFWISHDLSSPLNNAATKFRDVTSAEELFRYCTEDLRKEQYFNCDHADVLLVEKSDSGVERLVLKASSNRYKHNELYKAFYELPNLDAWNNADETSKTKVNNESDGVQDETYSRSENEQDELTLGLTTWTAVSKRGSRYSDLFNNDIRNREQCFYQYRHGKMVIRPRWENRVSLTGVVRNVMLLPITSVVSEDMYIDWNGKNEVEIVGVLRFANKRGGKNCGFTAFDLRIGELLSRYYIEPAVRNCKNHAYRETVHKFIAEATIVSALGAPVDSEPIRHLASKILTDPKRSSERRLTICRVDDHLQPKTFDATVIFDGIGGFQPQRDKSYCLKDTIIEQSLNVLDPITYFADELCDNQLPKDLIGSNAVVVVAVKIVDKDKKLGVLLLSSTKYDLVHETDLAGVVLSLADVFGNSFRSSMQAGVGLRLSMLRHDFRDLIDAMEFASSINNHSVSNCICNLLKCLIETICIKSYSELISDVIEFDVIKSVCEVSEVVNFVYGAKVGVPAASVVHRGYYSEPAIVTFLYGALHNALDYGARESVGIEIESDENFLRISVRNTCENKRFTNNLLNAQGKVFASAETSKELRQPSGIGIPRLSSMLKGIGGKLTVEVREEFVCVTGRFPRRATLAR
ncbi:MAG: hypothetical protein ACOVQN_02450 [Exiguobacterium sp.]